MIKLIFLDVDGCLTDGGIIYNSDGSFTKKFYVNDGAAMEGWQKMGLKLAIITGRVCPCVDARAKDLKIGIVRQGIKDKLLCAKEILAKENLSMDECAAIGDYYNDQKLLDAVGLSFKPANAPSDLKTKVSLHKAGGKGAVEEMIKYIINTTNLRDEWLKLW